MSNRQELTSSRSDQAIRKCKPLGRRSTKAIESIVTIKIRLVFLVKKYRDLIKCFKGLIMKISSSDANFLRQNNLDQDLLHSKRDFQGLPKRIKI